MRTLSITSAVVAVFVFLSFAADVSAQTPNPDDRARELYEEGESAYAAGRYEQAVNLFTEAHDLSGRSALLFNIANAEERRGNFQQAADALKRYVAADDATDVDAVNQRIAGLERRAKEKVEREKLAAAKADSDPKLPGVNPGTGAQTSSGGMTSSSSDTKPSATPGIVLVAVGGAAIAGGLVAGLLSRSAGNDAKDTCQNDVCPLTAKDDIDRARNLALVSDIAVVSGVALTAVGAYLLIRRSQKGESSRAVAFDVGPTRGGFAASLSGRF